MRFEGIIGRIETLEAEATAGKIATTDEAGNRAWVEGSGLNVAFDVLKLQTELSKEELELSDLPEDLRGRVSLWSRCNASSQAERMTKQLCEGIMRRSEPCDTAR